MDQAEINNWQTIAESMEAKGDTESWLYLRARAIAEGKPDPMPNVAELMDVLRNRHKYSPADLVRLGPVGLGPGA